MSREHQGEEPTYFLPLHLTPYQLVVLHDLVEEDMYLVEKAGYTGNDHYQALAAIEGQIAAFRGRDPRKPVEPQS